MYLFKIKLELNKEYYVRTENVIFEEDFNIKELVIYEEGEDVGGAIYDNKFIKKGEKFYYLLDLMIGRKNGDENDKIKRNFFSMPTELIFTKETEIHIIAE